MDVNTKIKILCANHVRNTDNICKMLLQNYVLSMQRRKKAFLKKINSRHLYVRMAFEVFTKNNISNALQIQQRLKRKPPKVWMKRRSSDWWNNIVKTNSFDEWMENFRVDRETFEYLCSEIGHELQPDPFCVREPLQVDTKVAIALYKLASCAEYRVVGNQFGVHKTSVHRCLKQFCAAVIKLLLPKHIKMPTLEEGKEIIGQFKETSGISPVLAAIDGTHIPVTPPEEGYRDFINRKC